MITDIEIKQEEVTEKQIRKEFDQFIIDHGHPCVMAQTMFRMNKVDMHVYNDFGSAKTASKILHDLQNYLDRYNFDSNEFYTFIAVFKDVIPESEEQFETLLWQQLQQLHEIDDQPWDAGVSADPASEKFSFSLLKQAFYIVGMHPNSSRKARQSPYPAMVFNLHQQFELLRKMGRYKQVRDIIRKRDVGFEGDINPMLTDFGDRSEARQYSGRKVDEAWKCPFHHK